MRNIDDYCELARSKNGLKNNAALARALGVSHNSPTGWKTRRTWPSDEVMIKLAKLAGVDPAEALLDLNIWRSNGEAISIYSRMRQALSAAVIALVVLVAGQVAIPQDATAKAYPTAQADSDGFYIMENIDISKVRIMAGYAEKSLSCSAQQMTYPSGSDTYISRIPYQDVFGSLMT